MPTLQEPGLRSKYDAYLNLKLERARQRVRATELAIGSLGLLALTFAYGLVMLLLDRWFDLPLVVRQLALGGFVFAATMYAVKVLMRPFAQVINPYYAARQVERTLPDAKNSLMSWLDLRHESLPPSVREAVSRRAAGDIEHADLDEAVHDGRLPRYGALAGILAVALIALLLVYRPTQFFSLLGRTFAPFSAAAIAHRTRIDIIKPVGGDDIVPINVSVDFRVDVDGRVPRADEPDALRLKLRYSDGETVWEEKPLKPTDRSGEWDVRVPAPQVRNGFEYQIVGGDAATPIHRIRVRAKALFTDFEVRYRYPSYTRLVDDTWPDPNLKAVRGTEVTLLAKANRPVRQGTMRMKLAQGNLGDQTLTGRPVPDRPDTLEFKLTLQHDGRHQYYLSFVAADGEKSDESLPYDVIVTPDLPPTVELTQAAPEKLPVNGTMTISGRIGDDYGLTKARLALRLKTNLDDPGMALPDVPYLGGKPLPSVDGREPRSLSIKEVLPLDQMKDLAGGKLDLRPGMVIAYRYQAEDNCDQPKAQLGQSKEYFVTLVESQPPEQRDADRQAANQEKKEHDDKQEADAKGEQPQDGGGQPNDQPMKPEDQKTIDQAKRIADELNKNDQGKNEGDQNQANKESGKPDSNHQKPQPSGDNPAQPKNGDGAGQEKSKSEPGKDQSGNEKTGKVTPEKNKSGNGNQSEKANEQKQPGDDAGKEGGEPRPEQMNQPGQQRDENNKSSGDQKGQQDKAKPGAKTSETPENKKPDDKTEKSGEKSGMGAKEDKPNDTTPQSSPDKGNADQGKPGSQRAGEGDKKSEKTEKPNDAAVSGKADPKAGKPDQEKSKGANNQGDKKPNEGKAAKPEGEAKSQLGQSDKSKAESTKDAEKPHGQPGDKPTVEPKTKGVESKSQPGEKSADKSMKPEGKPQPGTEQPKGGDAKEKSGENAPKPADIQKLIDDFKKMDPKNRELLMKQLEEQLKNAATPERKQAFEDAIKECKECNNPSADGQQPKPSDKAGGQGKANQPGKGSQPGADKVKAEQPGDQGDMKPQTGDGKPKPPDIHNHGKDAKGQSQPDRNGKPGDKGQPKDDAPKAEKSEQPKANGPGTAAGNRDGQVDMPAESGPAARPNEKFLREAGELQLEQFHKKVDKKVLEQLKMTDEEFQAFLRSYENLVKRSKDLGKAEGDDRARGAATGGSSANAGAKKVDGGKKSGPQTQRGGRGPAPAEFRDQYREFTEEQSKQAKPKDK